MISRYQRQELLPEIGSAGQARIGSAGVLIVGCGALGTVMAEHLVRAGVGRLRLVDRDIVELTNLQRQTLFTEADARDGRPKAIAAAERLKLINSEIKIEAHAIDLDAGNIGNMIDFAVGGKPDLILDGTDNVETRYLINDLAIQHAIPWVYAAVIGMEGRVMGIKPGVTPCLRCIFEQPPNANDLPTCDTAGVLAPASSIIASLAVVEAFKLLLDKLPARLISANVWTGEFRKLDISQSRNAQCPCCGRKNFEFLERRSKSEIRLCGRNAVQIRGEKPADFSSVEKRLAKVAVVQATPYMVRAQLHDPLGITLSIFPDGRVIVAGTSDAARARSLVSRFCGR